MTFNLDDAISKLADVFERSAERHYAHAEQAEQLYDLVTDPELRAGLDALVARGGIFTLSLLERLKGIFPQDEEEAPEPESAPEPEAGSPFDAEFVRQVEEAFARSFGIKRDEDDKQSGTSGGRWNFPF